MRPLRSIALLTVLVYLAAAGCEQPDSLVEIQEQLFAGQAHATLEPLRKMLAEDPDNPQVNLLYGQALTITSGPTLAEWSLRKAMRDPAWKGPAALQLAQNALSAFNYPAAIEAANIVLEIQPESVEALIVRAIAQAHLKLEPEEALADAERIFELDPDNVVAYEPQILALLALLRVEEAGAAIEAMGERIEKDDAGPERRSWHCATQAIFTDESEEFELATELWGKCVEKFPSASNVVWGAARFFEGRGDLRRGVDVMRGALEADPDSAGAASYRIGLADRLRNLGENAEAEEVLREGTQVEGIDRQASAWVVLAHHHQELDDYAAGAKAIERAVELARELGMPSPQLVLEYSDSLLLAGEFDRALEVADEVTAVGYRELIRARVAQERGQPAIALEHFDAAFLLWPDNPWARYYAAHAAAAIGDFDRTIDEYRYAIRIEPSATDARERLGRLLVAEGREKEAIQALRLKVSEAPLEVEGEVLSLKIYGILGNYVDLEAGLEAFYQRWPAEFGKAAAAAAEGVHRRDGAQAAVDVLRSSSAFALTDPQRADALRVLVRLSHEAGILEEAAETVRAALQAHPDAGVLHEIHGLALELGGGGRETVRAAYQRAHELEPENAYALAGLGRMTRDSEQAVSFFDRAATADPDSSDSARAAVEVLIASGKSDAAEERLAALLLAHPYDSEAAMLLAVLELERGSVTEQTRGLAQRSVRFGGGEDATELLARVQEKLDEAPPANESAPQTPGSPEPPQS